MEHPLNAKAIILDYICPAFGTVIAFFMFTAPVQSVRDAVSKGALGSLNPTPWAFMTGNCVELPVHPPSLLTRTGWVAYGLLRLDPFIFCANAPGFVVSVWLNLCASKLIYQGHAVQRLHSSINHVIVRRHEATRLSTPETANGASSAAANDSRVASMEGEISINESLWEQSVQLLTMEKAPVVHEVMVVAIASFWTLLFALVAFIPMTASQQQLVVGITVNVNLMFFYGAPLSTILSVIRKRNTSSVHVLTMLMNTANGAFWFAYGLGINDWLIIIPNGLGALLGLIQVLLCIAFPTRGKKETKSRSDQRIIESVENEPSNVAPLRLAETDSTVRNHGSRDEESNFAEN